MWTRNWVIHFICGMNFIGLQDKAGEQQELNDSTNWDIWLTVSFFAFFAALREAKIIYGFT